MINKKNIFLMTFLLMMTTQSFAIPVEDFITEYHTYMSYIEDVQNVMNQARMIEYQSHNSNLLSNMQWDDAFNDLNRLNSQMNQGDSMSYANNNFNQKFSQLFPGSSGFATDNYSQDEEARIQANQATMHAVISEMNESYQEQQNEARRDEILKNSAKTTTGRMQAIQVGNEIQAEQIAQLQKLRTIMMAQANAEAEESAYRTQKDAEQQKSVDAVVQNANMNFPSYSDNPNFGVIPQFGN